MLVEALSHVGHYQTRNRGTVGGSVALGEPAAEMPATAVALGAAIEVRSLRGTRMVPAREFYLGPYMTVLEPDELVTGIVYPDWPSGHVTLFREVAQRPGDFALVGMVGALAVEGGAIAPRRACLVRHGADADRRMASAEAALVGSQTATLDAARHCRPRARRYARRSTIITPAPNTAAPSAGASSRARCARHST